MGKDLKGGPAFPFYAQDFLVGVMYLENSEIGGYIKLLSYQWVNGPIPKKRLGNIIGVDFKAIWEAISDKFLYDGENIFNKRLEDEREKRAKFSSKQSENAKKRFNKEPNKNQSDAKLMPKKVLAMPLENENENENENESKKENEIRKVSKIENQKIIDIYNSVCKNLPAVQKLTAARKSAINARIKEYDLKTIGDVLILVSQSAFLNGDNVQGWKASFDWIFNPTNFIKILENNYNGTKSKQDVGKTNVRFSSDLQQKIARGLQS